MKFLQKTAFLLTTVALVATSIPCSAAPHNEHGKPRTPYEESNEFDGQAYYASRYLPAMRPGVMVGGLLLTALIVVVLQRSHHHSKSSH